MLPKADDLRTSTVIVEPVGPQCNLSCFYCYHGNIRNEKLKVMVPEVLSCLIEQSLKLNEKRMKFLWHGGEPMLAGLDFFRTAVKLQEMHRRTPSQSITNHLQTNATLIDGEWADFFETARFKISTSIDGPEPLHNACRVNAEGRGSYAQTVAGIEVLRRHGLQVGVVCTVSRYNAEHPDTVYRELLRLGIRGFEINIVSPVQGAPSLAPAPEKAVAFLTRTFDLWFEADDPTVHIRIFENTIRALAGLPVQDCSFSYNRCREYVATDENGDLYTCGRFLKERAAYIGSCRNGGLTQIMTSPHTQTLYDQVSKIRAECQRCEWLEACGGGCAYQRWTNGGFGAEFPQCEIRQRLFEHIKRRVTSFLPRS